MDIKKINPQTHFNGLYEATAYVQEHTLINRGITTLAGSTVPQCIMSNNKDEARERAIMGGVYFIASYLTPILLLPLYNKHFLKNKGIIKSVNDIGKRIIQVPKKYLTPEGNLKEGLHITAKKFDKNSDNPKTKIAFDKIYSRFEENKLKKDLLSVHEKILMTDFITTGAMWSLIPWIATESTEKITKRKDFSAGFKLKKENKNKNSSKKNKIIWNIIFSTIPGIIFSKAITKGLSTRISKNTKNPVTKLFNLINKKAGNFDYTSGTNMSKTIYAAIWILSSFPAKLISSRDNNERRDRALRDAGLFTMFFGGDFLLNNILGRTADKFLKTKLINRNHKEKSGFFKDFGLSLNNFRKLEELTNLTGKELKKNKTIGAGIYWTSLLTNTALIGFALPKLLNKLLRKNINKELENTPNNLQYGPIHIIDFVK